jgi:hypothetical protein
MIWGFARPIPNRRGAGPTSRERVLIPGVPDVTRDDPNLAAGSQAPSARALSRGYLFLGSHCKARLGN